jgi:ribosome-binding factor A
VNSSNKHTSFKIDRIESEVLNILNHTLKFIIYDEFLKEVSFTYVKIDSGCTIATIAVDTFNRSNIDKIVTKLNECKGIFRSELAKYMKV